MQQAFQGVTILRATVGMTLLEVGIKQGDFFYLVRDSASDHFCVVQWNRVRWLCSCGKGACAHKLAANEFAFEESQKRRIIGDDLEAHVEDDLKH